MIAKVQKWGNSLALRIPRTFALEAKLENDSDVDISLVEGQLVIKPIIKKKLKLAQLLSGITDDNMHKETETGEAIGKEIW